MPRSSWSSMWDLAAAQAQMDAISAALMPVGRSPSGRLQVPSVEIQDQGEALLVTAFLPGVEPQAVQVRATAKSLTFFGQRQSGYRSALGYGLGINHFQQTVPLPTAVQDRHMQVTYQQGAIVVTLPKSKGFGGVWSAPRVWEDSPTWTLGETLQRSGQSLGQGWQRLKHWLGHHLRRWGDRLLTER